MNTKRLFVILIAVAFALIVLISCVAVFSVKKVNVEFSVASDTDISAVEETLNEYVGKNLLFLKVKDVEEALKEHYKLKVIHIEKQYPNVLNVKLEERRETYYLEHGEKVYFLTEEGFVLNVIDNSDFEGNTDRDKIALKIKTIDMNGDNGVSTESDATLQDTAIGDTVTMQGDIILSTIFKLAKSVNLTDCIKELRVEKIIYDSVVAFRDMVITTYTGVKIRIMDVDKRGEEKIKKAFLEYDNASTDYIKTYKYIMASVEEDGSVSVGWSTVDLSPFDVGQRKNKIR